MKKLFPASALMAKQIAFCHSAPGGIAPGLQPLKSLPRMKSLANGPLLAYRPSFPKNLVGPHSESESSFWIPVRSFLRPVLNAEALSSVSILEIKKFLRQKAIEVSETHSSFRIPVPKHILYPCETSRSAGPPPSQWTEVENALTLIYVNKTTGEFVCPDLALYGAWNELRDFLAVWCLNRNKKRKDAPVPYPPLKTLNLSTPHKVTEVWSRAVPLESLSADEFKELLKRLKLPVRDLKVEDFVRYEVRVNAEQDELYFPVRYIHGGPILSLRRVYFSTETRQLEEDHLPDVDPAAAHHRIFPLPHGLDLAHRSQADSVVLVASVMDSVALSSSQGPSNLAPLALAEGHTCLPPDHIAFLEEFDRVKVWFPPDPVSFDNARGFVKKLDEKRCDLMNREILNPLLCLKKRQDISTLLETKMKACAHEYITTFESLRQEVFLELAQYEETEGNY